MHGSLGFFLFLIIAIVSAVKRHYDTKQEEERRRSMPKTRPEDLPEATRRMLYGDTQVPTARERQAPTQPTVIVARPRQTVEPNEEGPRPVPPPRPYAQPPPLTPTTRPMQLPIPPRPMQPSRPVVMQPRRVPPAMPPRTPAQVPSPSAAREIITGAGRMPSSVASPARIPDDGNWVYRDQLERRRQEERAQGQATVRANAARKQRLFTAGTDLRRAILMNEILGPPVAMRDPFGPFQSGPGL